jgi:hypothetical protein
MYTTHSTQHTTHGYPHNMRCLYYLHLHLHLACIAVAHGLPMGHKSQTANISNAAHLAHKHMALCWKCHMVQWLQFPMFVVVAVIAAAVTSH